jgi:hypothetical protein
MSDKTFYGELVKIETEGKYVKYVFKLDDGTLKQCTKLINWGAKYDLSIGDKGYLTIREIKAGDTYYDKVLERNYFYNYSQTYFQDFIKDDIKEIYL